MLASYKFHWGLAGGYYPKTDVVFRAPATFLPKPSIRFDSLVDHLCRVLLGRESTALLLQAACEATEVDAVERDQQRPQGVRDTCSRG